jgi:hypothetical protein
VEADEKARIVEDLLKAFRHGQINALVEEKNTRMLLRLDDRLFRRVVDYILEEHAGYHLLPRNVKEAIAECRPAGIRLPVYSLTCPVCGGAFKFRFGAVEEKDHEENVYHFCPVCDFDGQSILDCDRHVKAYGEAPPHWDEEVKRGIRYWREERGIAAGRGAAEEGVYDRV